MFEHIHAMAAFLGISTSSLTLAGVGIGSFVVIYSLFGLRARQDPAIARLRAGRRLSVGSSDAPNLLRQIESAPRGLAKTFVPENDAERTRIRLDLNRAGFKGPNAVRNYYLIRLIFGVLLPLAFAGLFLWGDQLNLPPVIDQRIAALSQMQMLQIVAVTLALGFYGPMAFVSNRAAARKLRIQQEFPKALDLLRVAVEAGMGIDAAIQRVAVEMAEISPEITEAFRTLESELLAGRDRDSAMLSMARNMGIDEVNSFVNVVMQSIQFGSSISDALQVYSDEMRLEREMRAQEKANKLPVQMSGVMAMLLLPALLMITLGPVVIRYIRYFSGA